MALEPVELDIKAEMQQSIEEEKERMVAIMDDEEASEEEKEVAAGSEYLNKTAAFNATLEAMKEAIRNEIKNDPAKKGYAGKTSTQIAALLNESYTEREKGHDYPPVPRVSAIFAGIQFAPNVVDEALVQEALEK